SSLTTARRILKFLISPMVQPLIEKLQKGDPKQTDELVERLQNAVGDHIPQLWRVNLCPQETTAAAEFLAKQQSLTLGDIIRDPHNLSGSISCVPLIVNRNEDPSILPRDDESLRLGDEILFCGTAQAKRMLSASLNNTYTLDYLMSGTDPPRGYFFRWLATRTEPFSTP
ncbi:MAG: hypothetical protein WBM41_07550, partial [Arenicellales bacterium]